MKHLALGAAFMVLALAQSERAWAQTVTSTGTTATTTTTVTSTSTSSATLVHEQGPKRVRRKIVATAPHDYRHPSGSVIASFLVWGGYNTATGSTEIAFGLAFGYALLTGVVPGIRGELLYRDGIGAQVAATMTLTPPLTWSVTPFALGEVGLDFEQDRSGTFYGAGGGAFVGDPAGHVAVQIGWIWRRLIFKNAPDGDGSGPIIGLTYRF